MTIIIISILLKVINELLEMIEHQNDIRTPVGNLLNARMC